MNTNNMRSGIAKKCHQKMDMFKDKSELIPVTAGDSHLSKNENLGSELCRTILAELFYFFFFLNTYKNAKYKTVANFCSLFQSKQSTSGPRGGSPQMVTKGSCLNVQEPFPLTDDHHNYKHNQKALLIPFLFFFLTL